MKKFLSFLLVAAMALSMVSVSLLRDLAWMDRLLCSA